jgi:hypothetical protein
MKEENMRSIGRRRRIPERELFGGVLRQKRHDLGLPQVKVVAMLRRTRSAQWLSRFERGRFLRLMPVEEFRDLCRVMHLDPVELLIECGFITPTEVSDHFYALRDESRRAA